MDPLTPDDGDRWSEPTAPRARTQRQVWRRRRRVIGTLSFVAAVVILGIVIALTLGGDDDEEAGSTATTAPSTTTTLPPAGPYRVTDGLNVRAGPGVAFPSVGTIEVGHTVQVLCVIDGDLVRGTSGITTKWLKIVSDKAAFVTAAYVSTGADITNPGIIPVCASP